MISLKIVSEFCDTNGNCSSITLDLLPSISQPRRSSTIPCLVLVGKMVDSLYQAIGAMSIEDEAPLTLPDEPRFRVIASNELSILGRLLNPKCQSMSRMIEFMPTAWRVYDRVRGIALFRDRFQFIFQREEDLATVLKDRPWSYNHWAMILERWTANPPENFLQTMEIWIRIRHIPLVYYTIDTMHTLASEIGHVEEIAYDPKVSQTKDYIRSLITFDVDKPAKATRQLNVPSGGCVTIEFEYEKIHKRCFHCLRLTHEKIRCPLLRRGSNKEKTSTSVGLDPSQKVHKSQEPGPSFPVAHLEGPPGFPPLFPELSKHKQQMAMLYISHSDETERRARIQRVRQGIENDAAVSALRITKVTSDIDKGKGHVFDFTGSADNVLSLQQNKVAVISGHSTPIYAPDDEADSSTAVGPVFSAPTATLTDFQLGPSGGGRVTGTVVTKKNQRRRPPAWKRLTGARRTGSQNGTDIVPNPQPSMKRKSSPPPPPSEHKSLKITETSAASVLKLLPPQ